MIPIGFPQVAPAVTVGELFGPLAPLALVGAIAALLVLVGLIAGEYVITLRRQWHARESGRSVPAQSPKHLPHAA